MDDTLKMLTPFITFILGIISTVLFKRFDKKKERLTKSLDEVRELTNAWYNQLHEVYYEFKTSPDKTLPNKFTFYVNNRLILPKLLHHVKILKKYKQADKFVTLTENFIFFVAHENQEWNHLLEDYNQDLNNWEQRPREVLCMSCFAMVSNENTHESNTDILETKLKELDRRLQILSIEAVNIKS